MPTIHEGAPKEVTEEHVTRAKELFEMKPLDNPPSAKEIVEYATGIDGIDARSKFGRALMLELDKHGINPKRAHQYRSRKPFSLTPEQQVFIKNNAGRLSAMECAKNLFGDKVKPLSKEARATREFYETIPAEFRYQTESEVAAKDYSPPKSMDRVIPRVNKYVMPGLDKEKLTNAEILNMQALITYLNTNRFILQINTYTLAEDREYFEGLFIRYTYDKPDLTQEEVDQYTLLCMETLIGHKNRASYQGLQELLDGAIQSQGGEDEKANIRMGLIEGMKIKEDEWHKCVTRQGKLKADLQGKRADRINQKDKNHGSWLPIIETWKHEESRKKMIKLAERRKKNLKETLDEYADMESLVLEMYGITEEEIING